MYDKLFVIHICLTEQKLHRKLQVLITNIIFHTFFLNSQSAGNFPRSPLIILLTRVDPNCPMYWDASSNISLVDQAPIQNPAHFIRSILPWSTLLSWCFSFLDDYPKSSVCSRLKKIWHWYCCVGSDAIPHKTLFKVSGFHVISLVPSNHSTFYFSWSCCNRRRCCCRA